MLYPQSADKYESIAVKSPRLEDLAGVFYKAAVIAPVEIMPYIVGLASLMSEYAIQDYTLLEDQESAAAAYNNLVMWTMNLCEALLECIAENPEAYQNALGIGSGGGGANPSRVIVPTGGGNLLGGFPCSPSNACAYAYGIVDTLAGTITQVLQSLAAANNGLELAAEIADGLPIVNALVSLFSTSATLITWLTDNGYEAWLASYDEITTRDMLAEEIRCLILPDCVITFDELVLFFAAKFGGDIFQITILELFENSASLSDNTAIMWAMFALCVGTLSVGERFGGILGASGFYAAIAKYAGDTSNDCDTFDPCTVPDWTQVFDFTAGTHGWTITGVGGTWVSGEGFKTVNNTYSGNPRSHVAIQISWDDRVITDAAFFCERFGGNYNRQQMTMRLGASPNTVLYDGAMGVVSLPISSVSYDHAGIYCQCANNAYSGYAYIRYAVLSGMGTNPFI